ncbi:pilus assembly protein TadG-related protein [Fontisubflavum oceani]|uniref:TadE/TadG family type IV pilus assembly protein n=1 Tax=Fontisubflavum oceani TaxID=2978973 RepID=UPI0025B2995A|nr:pilus assembly protein TadG-related protein [Fontisubflavum oceani]WJY23111.1 pilus assembly protein TadG-related protein [Fontisubflavum oceani]
MTARTKQTLQNRASLSGFARNEDGTITIFSVMMFVLMIGIGGIAIDVMRYETQRVQLPVYAGPRCFGRRVYAQHART